MHLVGLAEKYSLKVQRLICKLLQATMRDQQYSAATSIFNRLLTGVERDLSAQQLLQQ